MAHQVESATRQTYLDIELVRRVWDAFSHNDMELFSTFFADDAIVHRPGNNPLSGDYYGRGQILGKHEKLGQLILAGEYDVGDYDSSTENGIVADHDTRMSMTNRSYSAELIHVCADGQGNVVAAYREFGERNGKKLDATAALIIQVRNGQIVEIWELSDDLIAVDDFWS